MYAHVEKSKHVPSVFVHSNFLVANTKNRQQI